MCRRWRRRHDFLVLPAIEVNTEDGHILVYGLDKFEFGMHRIEQLAAMVEAEDGVMIAAHPYRRYMRWYHLEGKDLERGAGEGDHQPRLQHCIALETLHGRGNPQQNGFSEMLCELLRLPGTGGSDAHQPDHVGRCVTRFERESRNVGDLIAELQAGRFQAVDLRPATS